MRMKTRVKVRMRMRKTRRKGSSLFLGEWAKEDSKFRVLRHRVSKCHGRDCWCPSEGPLGPCYVELLTSQAQTQKLHNLKGNLGRFNTPGMGWGFLVGTHLSVASSPVYPPCHPPMLSLPAFKFPHCCHGPTPSFSQYLPVTLLPFSASTWPHWGSGGIPMGADPRAVGKSS